MTSSPPTFRPPDRVLPPVDPVLGEVPFTTVEGFVGRSGELRQLTAAFARACNGRGELVVLSGEAGAGKSALVELAAEQAGARGARTLWGCAFQAEDAPPYRPWTQLLRAASAEAPAGWPQHDTRLLGALVPELAPDGATREPGSAPVEGPGRFALFDAVRTALAELRSAGPLLLVLEDLHTADLPSLQLLQFLVHELRALPLLVIATYEPLAAKRDVEVDRLLASIAKEGRQLPLAGLTPSEVHHLVERTRGVATPRALAERVHRETAGNPALVLALSRGLDAVEAPETVERLPLPDGLRTAVHRRLVGLDEEALALLPPAAVLGPEVDLARLRPLVNLPREDLLRALGTCGSSDILVEDRDRPGRYRFRYEVVRQTVLADLPPAERAALHLRAAAAIESLHARDLDPHLGELARHYLEGAPDDVGRAMEITVRAARRAEELLEVDSASTLWRGALGLAERAGADRLQRCDLLLSLGAAQERAGDPLDARASFLAAVRAARAAGDGRRFARAVLGCAGRALTPTSGSLDGELVELLTEALERIGDDDALRSALLGRLVLERYHVDPKQVREVRTAEAVALAERSGDRAALSRALHVRHFALWGLDDLQERLANATEVLGIAQEANDADMALQARAWRIVAFLELGDAAALDREIAAHVRLSDDVAEPYHRWNALLFRAMRAMLQGRFDAAERHAQSALEIGGRSLDAPAETSRIPGARMFHGVQLLELRREQGRADELADRVAMFDRNYATLPAWRATLALSHLQGGRLEEAHAILEHLAAGGLVNLPIDANWLAAMSALAEVAAGLGEAEHAEELHRLLLPYEQRVVVVAGGAAARGPVAYYLGLLAATIGDHGRAVAHLERALALNERLGARSYAMRAQLALAGSLRALDREPAQAVELLRRAHTTAVELGLPAAAAQAELALADDGVLPQPDTAGLGAITPRPLARLVCEGSRWTVTFEGRVTHLRPAKGLRYLAALLAEPGVEHPASLLERLGTGAEALPPRVRFARLREELATAEGAGDEAQVLAVRGEMARLADELDGTVDDARAEQARVNVTRALRTALRNIARADPALAEHLDHAVRTGASCMYRPDPRAPISWTVEPGQRTL